MSAPLWTFDEIVKAMRGRPIGVRPSAITGISIDSRTVKPGEAFFAIRGDTFDGHDFATRALSAGAATAVVSEGRLSSLGKVSGSSIKGSLGKGGEMLYVHTSGGSVSISAVGGAI